MPAGVGAAGVLPSGGCWSGREDLNLRPQRPERCALTKLRYSPRPSYDSHVATNVSRADRALEGSEVLGPLMSPWFKLDDPASLEAPRKRGFWSSLGQFLFDYNRF